MNLKPGIKTTEFYATLALLVGALLVAFDVIQPAEQENVQAMLAELLTALAAFFSAAHVVARYIHGRTQLKLQALGDREI